MEQIDDQTKFSEVCRTQSALSFVKKNTRLNEDKKENSAEKNEIITGKVKQSAEENSGEKGERKGKSLKVK